VSAPGFCIPGLFTVGRIEVIDRGSKLGAAIAARLVESGVDAHAVEQASADAAGVVFVSGLAEETSVAGAIEVQLEAARAARTLAQRKAPRVFVTVQGTGGDFGLSGRAGERAWTAGLAGLAKTVVAEWPDSAAKAIDVALVGSDPDVVAARVASELLLGGRDVEVGLGRSGGRGVVHHRAAPYAQPSPDARIRAGSLVVVSGGARGVTAAALSSLCAYGPHLALLGRTELVEEESDTRPAATDADLRRVLLARAKAAGVTVLPKELARQAKSILDGREIAESVAALRRAGAQVSYHAVDVRDPDAVRTVIDACRQKWGPVRGVVHGAGVLADALLAAQSDAQFDAVFATKVQGLKNLLAATAEDPLELLLVFSSVAGRFGNSGQSAYAMANEVISCVAAAERSRRGPRCLVRSLAWGPWSGGMVTPGLAKLFEKAGVQTIALDAGARALAREVASEDSWPQVILMNGEPPATARPMRSERSAGAVDAAPEPVFDLVVNSSTYPLLDGHRIGGAPVVPAVLAVEWFCRAAAAAAPSLSVAACTDLKVLKGVPIEAFERRGARLHVHTRVVDAGAARARVECRLTDDQAVPRYSATIELGAGQHPAAMPPPLEDAKPWPWSVERAYSEVLFHRGPFAVIRALGVVSDTGATAEVVGARAMAWPDVSFCTDVAAMDGGVQVAVLWGAHVLGRLPLPMSLGAYRIYRSGPVDAAVKILVSGRRTSSFRAVARVAYVGANGDLLGIMEDLELYLSTGAARPSQAGVA